MKLSPFKAILIFLVLITTGIALIPRLSINRQPSEALPSVSVSYSWYSATGRVIEQEVTTPLEGLISRVRGVKNVSSVSSAGSGRINIEFDKTIDFDVVRFEISTIIRQAYPKFPQGVSYPSINSNRPNNENVKSILSYTLNAQASPVLIKRFAEDRIKPILSTVKGIQKVEIFGSTPMEWVMEYDADLLQSQGLLTSDIQRALNLYLSTSDAGIGKEIKQRTDTSLIHLVMRNYDPKDLDFLNIPVKKIGNRIVYLKDLVTMHHQEQKSDSYYRINGANTITIVVYANELENQLRISDKIKEKINEVKSDLPDGYFLLNSYDATEIIRQDLIKNAWRTFFTVLILLVFVLAISKQIRYLLLIVFSLIANLAISVIFYSIFNIEISLYSFAGIALSLGLVLENSLVMIEYYRRYHNRKVFMVLLAATLTTIAALMSVLYLEDRIRINLLDFSLILTINLAVSLVVALFLIPALMEKIPLKNPSKGKNNVYLLFYWKRKGRRRCIVRRTRIYERLITFMVRFRRSFVLIAILAFGVPLFLLPENVQSENLLSDLYNHTLGNEWYVRNVKSKTDKVTGGALRLFLQVYGNSHQSGLEQTTLTVNAKLPYGSTTQQMNELVIPLENFLLEFPQIEQFQTSIYGGQQSQITIYFKKDFENNGFPIQLKEYIIRKSVDLGGADWFVYGVGDGFNNSFYESLGNSRIRLFGFNYDELYHWTEVVKKSLEDCPRVRDVTILSRDAWEKDWTSEFVVDLDGEKLTQQNGSASRMHRSMKDYTLDNDYITSMIFEGQLEKVLLTPMQNKKMDIWKLQRLPNQVGKSITRLQDVAIIKKEAVSLDIAKENQQYCMILAYDYIGNERMGQRIQSQIFKEVEKYLPLGYSVKADPRYYQMGVSSQKQYWLLILVIVAIFFICSVLLESLRQPLVVIAMIPFSYIGIFLTFYFFKLNFDQGGFAAFILMSGLSINPALYLINEFDILRREYEGRNISDRKLYIKAFNRKIKPILLTLFAIILGLIPFLFGADDEAFWPALAGGTIGGLVFSIIGCVLLLPILLLNKKNSFKSNKK